MGTHSSDSGFITQKYYYTTGPAPATRDTHKRVDTEREAGDGGGEGLMLILLVLALSALTWMLI